MIARKTSQMVDGRASSAYPIGGLNLPLTRRAFGLELSEKFNFLVLFYRGRGQKSGFLTDFFKKNFKFFHFHQNNPNGVFSMREITHF
jgi:hypothetical protein